jgi:hypothetical protein
MHKRIDVLDALTVATHLLGIDEDAEDLEEQVEQKFYDKYDIEFDNFWRLLNDLAPLCDAAVTPITQTPVRGFSVREDGYGRWLARVDV